MLVTMYRQDPLVLSTRIVIVHHKATSVLKPTKRNILLLALYPNDYVKFMLRVLEDHQIPPMVQWYHLPLLGKSNEQI
jgi:hypothetical protein